MVATLREKADTYELNGEAAAERGEDIAVAAFMAVAMVLRELAAEFEEHGLEEAA